ncbi:MAG: right-handed parallel beta-helix repeat-containing protein [Clostridia bacterium]|nr:right-handed parallel beta-helix repeat-containing protein [Clostridia bacterium]
MKKFVSIFLALVLIFQLGVVAFAKEDGIVLYVSVNGDDSASGGIDTPLATLKGAKEKAKTIKGNVTVCFREGVYTFDETVIFDSSDKSDVTYKAYKDEQVYFTAAKSYSDFEECTVNGVRAFRMNVGKDAGITSLIKGDTTLKKTRWPEKGYLYPAGVSSEYCLNPEIAERDNGIFLSYRAMDVNKKDLPALKNPDLVVARILHWWKDELLPVKSYNGESGLMEFTKGASMRINTTDRYFLENVFEALNEPGEWYFDKPEGILYYIPEENETAEELSLLGGSLETLISITGVDGISFENIIFKGNGYTVNPWQDGSQAAYDAKSCLSYEKANNFSVKNCEFRNLSSCAVFMGKAVKDACVDSCIFTEIGAQAVYVRGDNVDVDSPDVTKNIKITNNIISGYGRIFFNAVGILIIHANSVEVCNNEIHDGYYTAISVGWVWGYAYTVTYNNKICDNLIYNIGQGWLSDMGGIYTLGNQPGTVLSGNVIHNVAADPDEGGYGGWGIYLDEGSAYITVEKNLCFACGSDGYHLHYGSYNTVRNNIFALNGESQVRVNSAFARNLPADGGKKSADFINNILLTDNHVRTYSYARYRDSFTDEGTVMWDLTNGDDLYIGYSNDLKKATYIRTALDNSYVSEALIFDPGFKDAANFDFELSDDSPAVKAGFEKWDYSQAGTKKGTVVGIETEGGTTPYNGSASPVELKQAKEPLHFVVLLWYRFVDFIKSIFNIK